MRPDYPTPLNHEEILTNEIGLYTKFLKENEGKIPEIIGQLRTIRQRYKQIQGAMSDRQSGKTPMHISMESNAGTSIINMDVASAQLDKIGTVINEYETALTQTGLTLEKVREQTTQ